MSLTFGAVSAEDLASDDGASDVLASEEGAVAGAAGSVEEAAPEADVATDVYVIEDIETADDEVVWAVEAINYGPDVAQDVYVLTNPSDNLVVFDYFASAGQYNPENGMWYVGDLVPDTKEFLILDTIKLDYNVAFVEALIVSSTPDPDLSNNYDIAYHVDGEEPVAEAAEETLPATGNPLAMALLALLVIGVGGIKRRF